MGEQEHACVLQGNSCLRVDRKEADVYLFGLVLLHMFVQSCSPAPWPTPTCRPARQPCCHAQARACLIWWDASSYTGPPPQAPWRCLGRVPRPTMRSRWCFWPAVATMPPSWCAMTQRGPALPRLSMAMMAAAAPLMAMPVTHQALVWFCCKLSRLMCRISAVVTRKSWLSSRHIFWQGG